MIYFILIKCRKFKRKEWGVSVFIIRFCIGEKFVIKDFSLCRNEFLVDGDNLGFIYYYI